MPTRCAISNCLSSKGKKCNTRFYKFPLQIEFLLKKWIEAANRENWTPTESSRICELHFKSTDFRNLHAKRRFLKADTIPTENLFYEGEASTQDVQKGEKILHKENIATVHEKQDCVHESEASTSQIYNKTEDEDLLQECRNIAVVQERQDADYIQESEASTSQTPCALKRKIEDTDENANKKMKQLEDEINNLKTTIECLENKNIQNLNKQECIFQQLMREKDEEYKKKLKSARIKVILLTKQLKRKERRSKTKMQVLLNTIKKNKNFKQFII